MHYFVAVFAIAMVMMLPLQLNISAANVSVRVNGESLYNSQDLLKSGVTYVPLRAFSEAVYDGFDISWNAGARTATVRDGDYVLRARVGDKFITVNGQRVYSTVPNILVLNRIHVPVRSLCTGMGLDIAWNSARSLVTVKGSYDSENEYVPPVVDRPDGNPNDANSEDLYWLSRIIHAESSGEPMAGKIAVGTVVMNRVKSSMYPNTIYGVIFDKKFGTQFTPVASGTIHNQPSAESIEAARRVLAGERTDSRILFFVNEKIATNNWISQNRTYILTIGNHKFYA
jgi:N-acetylmuramoyl-L-alanine amidase